MKAKLVGSMPVGAWIYEIKFDGYRALAMRAGGETRILSRNEKDLGSKFPAVRDSIAALDVQDVILAYAASGIMQSIFKCRVFLGQRRGARRLESIQKVGRRDGGLKMDWTKPLPGA